MFEFKFQPYSDNWQVVVRVCILRNHPTQYICTPGWIPWFRPAPADAAQATFGTAGCPKAGRHTTLAIWAAARGTAGQRGAGRGGQGARGAGRGARTGRPSRPLADLECQKKSTFESQLIFFLKKKSKCIDGNLKRTVRQKSFFLNKIINDDWKFS